MRVIGCVFGWCFFLSIALAYASCSADMCAYYARYPKRYKVQKQYEGASGLSMIDVHTLLELESSVTPYAVPWKKQKRFGLTVLKAQSSAYGYAQVLNATWQDYEQSYPGFWLYRSNFYDSIHFAHWYRNAFHSSLKASTLYEFYLLYHDGPGRYQRGDASSLSLAKKAHARTNVQRKIWEDCKKSVEWRSNWYAF